MLNVDPEKLPWDAIHSILKESLYGGKIDNIYDQKILVSLIDHFFTPKSFDRGFKMFNADRDEELLIPEARKFNDYQKWISKMPDKQTPAWSGLPNNIELRKREEESRYLIEKLWQLKGVQQEEEDETMFVETHE